MTDNMKKAIEKIDAEAEKAGGNAQIIAQYVIDKVMNEQIAMNINSDDKTLDGCMSEIMKKAKERAKNTMAMVADTEVWAWVREYFGAGVEEKKPVNIVSIDMADFL